MSAGEDTKAGQPANRVKIELIVRHEWAIVKDGKVMYRCSSEDLARAMLAKEIRELEGLL